MKSETYWIMAVWSILWLVGIGSQIKFSMNHDELRNELNAKNDKLESRIKVYEKLADPKSVQLYVSELNGILDNMTRLGKIIENGEEVDLALARIEKEYIILGQQVKMMITEINNNLFTLKEEQLRVDADLNDLFDADMDGTDKLTLVDNKIMNRIKVIQTDLDTIRSLIKDIQETKFDKLW